MATQSVTAEEMDVIRAHSRRIGVAPPRQVSSSSSHGDGGRSAGGGGGAVLVDPATIVALTSHFEQLLGAIAGRVQSLSEQTRQSVSQSHRRHLSTTEKATLEIERLKEILYQIDELELEFDRIRRIQEIVANFKTRIVMLERRIGR